MSIASNILCACALELGLVSMQKVMPVLLNKVNSRMFVWVFWESDGTRMHCRKIRSWQRQYDGLGKVLLGNTGSYHSYGRCYLTQHHERPNSPVHGNSFPQWQQHFSVRHYNLPYCTSFLGMVSKYEKDFNMLSWSPNPSDLNPTEHIWNMLDQCSTTFFCVRPTFQHWKARHLIISKLMDSI